MPGTLFGDDPIPTSPSPDWITAHCDGGARGNPGPAGFGAVLTDTAGHPLAELSEFLGVCSNNVAEYRGLLASLDWALAHGYTHLRVVSDSLLMVNQIKGRFKVNSPDLRPLWEDARRKIAKFAAFDIAHALRHKNKDADRLANEAMDRGMDRGPNSSEPARGMGRGPNSSEPARGMGGGPNSSEPARGMGKTAAQKPPSASAPPPMLRGFVRDGAIHLLGDGVLKEGTFVKVIPE
jgi:ribonuclease HI